jgi:thymidylate kinase
MIRKRLLKKLQEAGCVNIYLNIGYDTVYTAEGESVPEELYPDVVSFLRKEFETNKARISVRTSSNQYLFWMIHEDRIYHRVAFSNDETDFPVTVEEGEIA